MPKLAVPPTTFALIILGFMGLGVAFHYIEQATPAADVKCVETPTQPVQFAALQIDEPPTSIMTLGRFAVAFPAETPRKPDVTVKKVRSVKIAAAPKKKIAEAARPRRPAWMRY